MGPPGCLALRSKYIERNREVSTFRPAWQRAASVVAGFRAVDGDQSTAGDAAVERNSPRTLRSCPEQERAAPGQTDYESISRLLDRRQLEKGSPKMARKSNSVRAQPFVQTRSGLILKSTRTSPGWRYGYLSAPRYFLAILSMCSEALCSVTSTTRPRMPR